MELSQNMMIKTHRGKVHSGNFRWFICRVRFICREYRDAERGEND